MGTLQNSENNQKTDPANIRVYLLVCSVQGEYSKALTYATNLARSNGARLGILYVSKVQDFQNWANVEDRMRKEMREEAEKRAWSVADTIAEMNGPMPSIYLEEGDLTSVVLDVLERDKQIKALILEADTASSNPGPLVSHFSGKGVSHLRVPLIIVPDNIDTTRFDGTKK